MIQKEASMEILFSSFSFGFSLLIMNGSLVGLMFSSFFSFLL